MDDLEELKKRKERLELERDIARLERDARVGQVVSEGVSKVSGGIGAISEKAGHKAAKWSWLWVAPVGLFGALLFLAMIGDSAPDRWVFMVVGVVLFAPVIAKFLGKR